MKSEIEELHSEQNLKRFKLANKKMTLNVNISFSFEIIDSQTYINAKSDKREKMA